MLKKQKIFIFTLFLILSISIIGCDFSDDSTNDKKPSGTIKITSVSPSTGLINNTPTLFTVNVSYTLSSASQGELSIGFNNGDIIDEYWMLSEADYLISEGSGNHTFVVEVTTKYWGAQGDFGLNVIISEYPHETAWSPLGWDEQILTFK